MVSEAIIRISRRADASRLLAKFREVKLIEGRRPTASLSRGALQVTVVPSLGLAGRPSSERIVMVAAGGR